MAIQTRDSREKSLLIRSLSIDQIQFEIRDWPQMEAVAKGPCCVRAARPHGLALLLRHRLEVPQLASRPTRSSALLSAMRPGNFGTWHVLAAWRI